MLRRRKKQIQIPHKQTPKQLEHLRFGIEIEVEFPNIEDSTKLIAKHRIIRGWDLDQDWSLDNGAEYRPKKSNKLYYNQDSLDQINEIIGLIKAHKGNIRPSCGLHVHIDMTNFTNKQIVSIVNKFVREQNLIYKTFGVLKERAEETAKKIPKEEINKVTPNAIDLIRKRKYDSSDTTYDYLRDRTYGLNIQSLKKHHTLEFRIFNGTIQSDRIWKYIKWALEFCIKGSLK